MADRQIERARDYPLVQRARPRSLPSQVTTALLQPVYFFRVLPGMDETRQWLWAALLILALISFSAVRQQALTEVESFPTDVSSPPIDMGGLGGDLGGVPPGEVPGGLPPIDMGGVPPDAGVPVVGEEAGSNAAETWTTALIASSGVILGWFILAVLLSEVSLFNGFIPRLGHNFQIAIWTSLPLGLMAALQLLYYAAGGNVGQPGLSGLVTEWEGFTQQTPFVQSLLLSLGSKLTIFWLWTLMLIFFGARFALHGKRWSSVLVVLLWAVVVVVTPVVTGAAKPPEPEPVTDMVGEDMFFDPSLRSGEGETPQGDIFPDDGGELLPEGEQPPIGEEITREPQIEEEGGRETVPPQRPTNEVEEQP